MRKYLLLLLLSFNFSLSISAQLLHSLNSSGETIWKVAPVDAVTEEINRLSVTDYNTSDWIQATVPGTVFTAYVNAGLEADPNYGDNIYLVDEKKYNKPYWFRTEFDVPVSFDKEKIWLNFEGTNKKATIYLNGQELGVIKGHVLRAKYDITDLLSENGKNVLLVRIDIPKQNKKTDVFTNWASPTYISSASWDWMPYVPGLNCGITNDVYLSNTGAVSFNDPWIRSDLPSNDLAHLQVITELKNVTSAAINGEIKGVIQPGNIQFSKTVSIPANTEKSFTLDKNELNQLTIQNPLLWWPNGYGEPNLYTCNLQFITDGTVSDERDITFGIRRYDYKTENTSLTFYVNGEKVMLRGGNWGMSEYLLRCRGEEYETKIKLHADMNFNMIRTWTGCVTDEEFYQYCDKYGIMVWDDFWLVHVMIGGVDDNEEFLANAKDKIKKLRNHASIAVWCGANETEPPVELNEKLVEYVAEYDNSDRRYQPNSRKGGGLTGSGFWNNHAVKDYFTGIGSWGGDFGDGNKKHGLRTEIGTATFVNAESFKLFMPRKDWWPSDWQKNEMWQKHFFGTKEDYGGNADPKGYYNAVVRSYGKSEGIEEFCEKSQYLNLEVMKAMFEGWNDHLWDDATGILIWMSQSAYPSFVWQTYDYYHDATGAYWGAKKACEPLHVQWNSANNSVKVINTTLNNYSDLLVKSTVYNLDGTIYEPLCLEKNIEVSANEAKHSFTLAEANYALNKPAYSSANDSEEREPSQAVDGDNGTRWSSDNNDEAWIYIDLEESVEISAVGLRWESAYGKQYKIQVSDNAVTWKDVFTQEDGKGGYEQISFTPVVARYVKMQGIKRGTNWGYSLYEFEVFHSLSPDAISDLNFIRLELWDQEKKLLSENFYWRSISGEDYTVLNSLPKANLTVRSEEERKDGICSIDLTVTNKSATVAFGNRIKVQNKKTGERVLPVYMNDNYFTMMPGETKVITIEFDEKLIGKDEVEVVIVKYNDIEVTDHIEKETVDNTGERLLKIYPNPVADIVQIEIDGNIPEEIRIVGINGEIMLYSKGELSLDLSHLPKGFYLVQGMLEGKIYVSKLIKE